MLLATAPAMAVDCAAIRAACVERCQTVAGTASERLAPTDVRFRPANKRPLWPVFVMLPLRVFAAVHFAPVPMRASHRLLQHSPLSRLRLHAELHVARNSRCVWHGASAR